MKMLNANYSLRRLVSYILAASGGYMMISLVMAPPAGLQLGRHPWDAAFAFTVAGTVVTAISLYKKVRTSAHPTSLVLRVLFLFLLLPAVFVTGGFIYEAETAWRGTDVHWHADLTVVVNGTELDLIDPEPFCGDRYVCRLNDWTGTKRLHEHDDGRMHVHGPIVQRDDATLAAFFNAFKGRLTADALHFPTNNGWVNVSSTGNRTVKLFVKNGTSSGRQWRRTTPEYVISPYENGSIDHVLVVYNARSSDAVLQSLQNRGIRYAER